MAITKYEKNSGIPENLGNEVYVFDKWKWLNKCEIEISGKKKELFCVYQGTQRTLTSIIIGESITINPTGTSFVIRGWKVNPMRCKDLDLSNLINSAEPQDFEFKTPYLISPSFRESAIMVRAMQRFYDNKCVSEISSKSK